ncbi:hypothetical protein D3C75_521220 [compost metagenome]
MAFIPFFHVRKYCGDAVQDSFNIHVDHAIPLVHFQIFYERKRHNTRIINQNVDISVSIKGSLREQFHICSGGYVRNPIFSLTACCIYFFLQLNQPVFPACRKHDFYSAMGQHPCCCFSNAAACACYYCYFVFHVVYLLLFCLYLLK